MRGGKKFGNIWEEGKRRNRNGEEGGYTAEVGVSGLGVGDWGEITHLRFQGVKRRVVLSKGRVIGGGGTNFPKGKGGERKTTQDWGGGGGEGKALK